MRNILGLLAVSLCAARAAAQDPETLERIERALQESLADRYETTGDLTVGERARLLYGAYTTVSLLGADDEPGDTRVLRQFDGKFWAHAFHRGHQAYGRLRFRYRDFNTFDSFDGTGDDLTEPLGDRYWYRYSYRADEGAEEGRETDWDFWTQIGRQQVDWGSGL
ncbi:MAG: hypothetical protein ACREID_08115, partial [Planctomycetota bacterium]